jgi:hypothetical protein
MFNIDNYKDKLSYYRVTNFTKPDHKDIVESKLYFQERVLDMKSCSKLLYAFQKLKID